MNQFFLRHRRFALFFFLAFAIYFAADAQQLSKLSTNTVLSAERESILIRGGDIIALRVFDYPDLDQAHIRVTDAGDAPLLLIGSVHIAGLTPGEASEKIGHAYVDHKILLSASVQVTLESISSMDVTVIGSVNGATGQNTGMTFTLNSPRPLLSVLALAGGLSDRASRTVTIQRGTDTNNRITVSLPTDPALDLDHNPMVYPGDIVVVPRAGYVYVLGNVGTPKALVMNEDGTLTLLQAMSQAGGPLPTSSLKHVMLFRKTDGKYQPVEINVGHILKGHSSDIELKPEDALYFPFSVGKNLLVNAASITAALASSTASGLIYTH